MGGSPNASGDDHTRPLKLANPAWVSDFSSDELVGRLIRRRWEYVIRRKLGHGGFGAVYLAHRLPASDLEEESCPPEVAIKIFSDRQGMRDTALLKRELSALKSLNHPAVPAVYDWSLEPGICFVAMQYFSHSALTSRVEKSGPLSEEEAWALLNDLLSALVAAGRASLLHLDIKPSNVLVRDVGRFALGDFGLAQGRCMTPGLIESGLGTPGYQAPEQQRGAPEEFDVRTDLWGVGATVWSALTALNLFRRPELLLYASPDQRVGLPPVVQFRPDISPQLNEFLEHLLATSPRDRPGGPAEALALMKRLHRGDSAEFATPIESEKLDDAEIESLAESLLDPLWAQVCLKASDHWRVLRFMDGSALAREGEDSYLAYILLKGEVAIQRQGVTLLVEDREGTFLGELSTLTSSPRTATMLAKGEVRVVPLNAAEFEKLIITFPAAGIRLINDLARRLMKELELGRAGRMM